MRSRMTLVTTHPNGSVTTEPKIELMQSIYWEGIARQGRSVVHEAGGGAITRATAVIEKHEDGSSTCRVTLKTRFPSHRRH
jgi:hypothetical protein